MIPAPPPPPLIEPYERALRSLAYVRRTHDNAWFATCPCCGREDAFQISCGPKGEAYVRCYAACSPAEVIAKAVGLGLEDTTDKMPDLGEPLPDDAPLPDEIPDLTRFEYSDIGNGERLIALYGPDLRYCDELGGWLVYHERDGCWRPDTTGEADRRCKITLRKFREQLDAQTPPKDDKEATKEHKQRLKWAQQSENDMRVRAMLTRASKEKCVACAAIDFDAHPLRLNVLNGTIHLASGELHKHSREDMHTKVAPVRYDPEATHPDVEKFLNSVSGGDLEYREHIERCIGYSFAGDRREDRLIILFGPGNTGKTTKLEWLISALGDYATTVPVSAVLERDRHNGPRPELADTRGARIAIASEAPDGGKFDGPALKSFTGGDTICVRRLYENPIRFRASAVLWLACNTIPDAKDEGAMRRRIHILPFTREHEAADDDTGPDMRQRLKEHPQRSALLTIAVRGFKAWQLHGLGTCTQVESAISAYWGDGADPVAVVRKFIAAECDTGPDLECAAGELWSRFTASVGNFRLNKTRLGRILTQIGFPSRATRSGKVRTGLAPKSVTSKDSLGELVTELVTSKIDHGGTANGVA
jgi:putative DNA primase/helicase